MSITYVRPYISVLSALFHWIYRTTQWGECCYYTHFTVKENWGSEDCVTCLRSYSRKLKLIITILHRICKFYWIFSLSLKNTKEEVMWSANWQQSPHTCSTPQFTDHSWNRLGSPICSVGKSLLICRESCSCLRSSTSGRTCSFSHSFSNFWQLSWPGKLANINKLKEFG